MRWEAPQMHDNRPRAQVIPTSPSLGNCSRNPAVATIDFLTVDSPSPLTWARTAVYDGGCGREVVRARTPWMRPMTADLNLRLQPFLGLLLQLGRAGS